MDLALREEYSIKFCMKLIVVISPDKHYSQFYHTCFVYYYYYYRYYNYCYYSSIFLEQ
jgi:hypothetical protein